jgi:hypothetical protein
VNEIFTNAKGAADLLGVDEVQLDRLSCGRWALGVRIGDTWWARTLAASPSDNTVRIGMEAFDLVREVRRQIRQRLSQVMIEAEELRFSDETEPTRPRTRFDAIAEEMSL